MNQFSSSSSLSVVIPVYNSERYLERTILELVEYLRSQFKVFEIILVNDGSRDQSQRVALELASRHEEVQAFELSRNYGQHNALLFGIRQAKWDLIATMDDDGQHPPEELTKMLARLSDGVDVVYSAPDRLQHGLYRNLASKITKITLENVMGAEAAQSISAFRLFKANLRDGFAHYSGYYVSIDVLLTWTTSKFGIVKGAHRPRSMGESNYTLRSLFRLAGNMMTGFSIVPLQVATLIGLGFMLFGFVLFLSVIWNHFFSPGVPKGFAFLASAIVVFSGVQLFVLGVIGEYIARIHFNTIGKTAYFAKQTLKVGSVESHL